MSTVTEKYIPILVSERLEPNAVGRLDLCRAASFAMILNGSTNGEWMKNPDGTDWGPKKIAKLLEKMRAKTGEVLRGSFNTSHMDEFAEGAGFSADVWDKEIVPFSKVVEGLKTGKWGYQLSGDVRHTPESSPLRKHVRSGVGHDNALIKISDDLKKIGFIDPMTPHGVDNYFRWAPTSHFRKFASEFKQPNGDIIAGRVRKGVNREAAMLRRKNANLILKLQQDLDSLQKLWRGQQAELIVLDKNVADRDEQLALLEQRLAECQVDASSESEARLKVADLEDRLDRIAVIAAE